VLSTEWLLPTRRLASPHDYGVDTIEQSAVAAPESAISASPTVLKSKALSKPVLAQIGGFRHSR